MIRIVLESESDSIIRNAKVFSSYTLVRVELPEEFELQAAPTPANFSYFKKGSNIFFIIKNLKSIKLLRLKSPPRLVIESILREQKTEIPPYIERPTEAPPDEHSSPEGIKEGPLRRPVKKIVVDPGHGGHDLGIYTSRYSEKSIMSRIAKRLVYRLKKQGKRVYISRAYDKYTPIMKRILYTRKKSPDLFISLHMTTSNRLIIYTSTTKQLRDEEKYLLSSAQNSYLERSTRIAQEIGNSLKRASLNLDIHFRSLDIPVLSNLNCPAILIELPNAELFVYNRENIDRIVKQILEGIRNYEKG
jgi:N-acetylmuramoyl-L-alanine amidase